MRLLDARFKYTRHEYQRRLDVAPHRLRPTTDAERTARQSADADRRADRRSNDMLPRESKMVNAPRCG